MNCLSINSFDVYSQANRYSKYATSVSQNITFKQCLQKTALVGIPVLAATTAALLHNKQKNRIEENNNSDFINIKLSENAKKYEIVTKRCLEIYKQFGVQVRFTTEPIGNIGAVLTEIYNELQNFKMHRADDKKGLTRINITNESKTYWNPKDRSINIGTSGKGLNIENIRYSLRHEIVHDYDTKPELENKFPSSFDINNIDSHISEMLNAGLSPEEIIYAFGNRKELLSIISMSDMNKYSDNFKKILLDAGMPNNIFNIKTPISRNVYTQEEKDSLIKIIKDEIIKKGGIGFIKNTDKYYSNGNILLNILALNALYQAGHPTERSKKITKPKEETYSSKTDYDESDIRELDDALNSKYDKKITVRGNEVEIITPYTQEATKVKIRNEFLEDCVNNKERERLVKTWLLESAENNDYNSIPYELLLAAGKAGISDCDNYKSIIELEDEARKRGIIFGKYEKGNGLDQPDYINFTVNGKKHRMELKNPDENEKFRVISAVLGDEHFQRRYMPWGYPSEKFLLLFEVKE